jgi:uncharacterized protein
MTTTPSIAPWHLAPEGALIHPGRRLAVVADVHLGYEWARGQGGDCLPAHSLAETLAKLSSLLARSLVNTLVVAGDLFESPRPCRRTAADVASLTRWLADRGVSLVALEGNHDPRRVPPLAATLEVDGWTIGHGHRPINAPRTIRGHDHPFFRVGGVSAPCFLVSPNAIVLPAFSPNAAGGNVAAGSPFGDLCDETMHCVVAIGPEWLDFGPIANLRKQLNQLHI